MHDAVGPIRSPKQKILSFISSPERTVLPVWDGWGDVERNYKENLVTRAVLHIHPALCGDFFKQPPSQFAARCQYLRRV